MNMTKRIIIFTGIIILVSMSASPDIFSASLQGQTADELVRTYGALYQKDHPLVSTAQTIFRQVRAAADKKGERYPDRLLILRKSGGPLAWVSKDGKIVLTRKGMEFCFKDVDKETGSARLAFILGHELAHLAKDDDWHGTVRTIQNFETNPKVAQDIVALFSEAEDTGRDRKMRRRKELEADAYGLLYACMAGYDYHAIVDNNGINFFQEVLNHTPRPDSEASPYPEPEERAEILFFRIKDIRNDLDLFHWGVRLYQMEMYEDALNFLTAFRKKFPCREVFSNIGLVYYQMAMKNLTRCDPDKTYRFKLATRADTRTRAEMFTRSEECVRKMILFTEKLNEAIRYFRAACEKDASYAPARINLSSAFIMAEKYSDAMAASDEALRLRPDDPEALSNKAVAMYLLGPLIKVDMYHQASDALRSIAEKHTGHSDALYNLARMRSERGRNAGVRETWEKYLAARPAGLRAEHIRKSLGIKKAPEAGRKNRLPDFIGPSPVRLGEVDSETMKQLKSLTKHPLENIWGAYYRGKDIRVLELEGAVELVEVPVRQKVRFSEINDEPGRILKSSSGMMTLIYDNAALDVRDGMAAKVVHFQKHNSLF